MALPQAVKRQVEEAEALQRQLSTEIPAQGEGDPPAEQPAPEAVAEPPPTNVVELPKSAPEPQTPAREDTVEYWRARFDTLRGKYDAEVPQLHQRLKSQEEAIQQLAAKQEQLAAEPPKSEDLLTADDIDRFGDDWVSAVKRAAQDALRPMLKQAVEDLRKEFATVLGQVEHVTERVVKSEADKFWDSVRALVPDWDAIEQNPNWFGWLDTTPDWSELTYRELAGQAIQNGRADKVAKLVELWRGPVAPAAAQPSPQDTLALQVAPSTTKGGGSLPPAERIWTEAEYKAAYDPRNRARLGVAQAAALTAEADRAVAEGRVRWT